MANNNFPSLFRSPKILKRSNTWPVLLDACDAVLQTTNIGAILFDRCTNNGQKCKYYAQSLPTVLCLLGKCYQKARIQILRKYLVRHRSHIFWANNNNKFKRAI